MLVDNVMIDGSHGSDVFHQSRSFGQVFANLHTRNRSFNRRIIGPWLFLFRISAFFRVESIDLGHPTTEPQHDTVFRFSTQHFLRRLGSIGCHHCTGRSDRSLNELTSFHLLGSRLRWFRPT